ncbi:MAG TPA: FtsX-like permease family protein [Chitinophagaceae bacterium]|nr:FtsX-like permease family protein [Chitinophagaceae bacterium]
MNFLFAWRYFKAKKSTNAINIIAWVSVIAVATGTAALIILLSVFNGFEGLVKSMYADFYSELKVAPASGNTLTITENQLKQVAQIPGVHAWSLVMEEKALLQNGEYQSIVYVKGVDSQYKKVVDVSERLTRGKFELGTPDHPATVLGIGVEHNVAVESDKALLPLTIYLPRKGVSMNTADPLQSLSADIIATSGSFMIQQDFDNKYIITNLGFIKRMLDMGPDEYGALEIRMDDAGKEAEVKQQLAAIFARDAVIQNRFEQNRSLYSIMQTEKWVIYAILSLILVVAAFTMIGSLMMLVLEKRKDIQVLKALGADNRRIQQIFLSEGLLLAFIGSLLGASLAILTCWLQTRYHLIPLEGDTFVINYYPVKIAGTDIILVLLTVFIVAWLASWLPARKASLQPIELRS